MPKQSVNSVHTYKPYCRGIGAGVGVETVGVVVVGVVVVGIVVVGFVVVGFVVVVVGVVVVVLGPSVQTQAK